MPSISYKSLIQEKWTKETYNEFQNGLLKLRDKKYKEFNSKITPTEYEMIGIRVPILRDIAKEISKTNIYDFLNIIQIKYFEETILYGIVISYIEDYETFIKYFHKFIDYIDNWATCDLAISKYKIIEANQEKFKKEIDKLLELNNPFYIRVAVVTLLEQYINNPTYLDYFYEVADSIDNDNYYVKMAVAWFISYLFINYRTRTLSYLKDNNLDKFTNNKAISKIRESYRVSNIDKKIILKYKK